MTSQTEGSGVDTYSFYAESRLEGTWPAAEMSPGHFVCRGYEDKTRLPLRTCDDDRIITGVLPML